MGWNTILYNQIDISKNLVIKLPTKLNISMRVSQFVQAAHLAHVSLRRSIKRGSGWFSHGRKQQFSNLFCLLLLALFILFCPHQVVYLEVKKACSPCVPILHRIPAPVSSPSVTGCLPARSSGPIVLAHLKTGPLHNCATAVCSQQHHSFPSRS